MNRNHPSEATRISKLQIKDIKKRKNSPQSIMFLRTSYKQKQRPRHISPDIQSKTSRSKFSHPKVGLNSNYDQSFAAYNDKHLTNKRRSSVYTSMARHSKEKQLKQNVYVSKSNGSKFAKKETVKIANNLKQILEKHLALETQKKKFSTKKDKSKQKQKDRYLSYGKNNLQAYEKQIRKSKQKTSSRIFNNSPQKIEQFFQTKQRQKTKRQTKQQGFTYVLKYSYRSRKGHTPNNPSKPNQDSYIISTNLHNQSWSHYFGVCDGHGTLGHKVSGFLKQQFPNFLKKNKELQEQPVKILTQCFKQTSQKLCLQSKIDLSLSGSTCIGCYLNKDIIYCSNVGDSRAIIGWNENKWVCSELSEDHKPSLKSQAKRIKQHKGLIQPFKHPDGSFAGPLRVWLPQGMGPGLAMTRSFGDLIAASVGVSCIPEIRQYKMTQKDKIIVIASDGVWQFMQNIQVINLLSSFYTSDQIQLGCDKLLYTVYNKWIQNSSVIDDITFVVIFLYYE